MVIRLDTGPRDAKATVFVHGAGMAGWMWKKQIDHWPAARKIIVDLPDHGLDRGRPFTSIKASVAELAALIASECPGGKAFLVGHSLGARIVLETLARYPDCAAGAVVSSALVRPSLLVSMLNSHTLNVFSLWLLRNERLARMQARQFGFADSDMEASYLEDIRVMTAENLERPVSAFSSALFLPAGLEAVNCPVLVTVGSKETRGMLASAGEIAAAIPGAEIATLQGADHTYPWSHFDAYNNMLASHPASGLVG